MLPGVLPEYNGGISFLIDDLDDADDKK